MGQVAHWRDFLLLFVGKAKLTTLVGKEAAVGFPLETVLCSAYFISLLLSRVLQVLQAASFEAGWEKDAVFLPLSPSWQLAVVG